jgi:hypothetical protein
MFDQIFLDNMATLDRDGRKRWFEEVRKRGDGWRLDHEIMMYVGSQGNHCKGSFQRRGCCCDCNQKFEFMHEKLKAQLVSEGWPSDDAEEMVGYYRNVIGEKYERL